MSIGPKPTSKIQPVDLDPKAILQEAFPFQGFAVTPEDVIDVFSWAGIRMPLADIENGNPLLAKAWARVLAPILRW